VATTLALSPGEVPAGFYTAQEGTLLLLATNKRLLYKSREPRKRTKDIFDWTGWPLEEIRELKLLTRTKSSGLVVVAFIPIPTPGSENYLIRVNGIDFDMGSEDAASEAFRLVSKARLLRMIEIRRMARLAKGQSGPVHSRPP